MGKIPQFLSNNKDRILLGAAVVLIAFLSFGLGYLIRGEVKKSPIIIEAH